MDYKCFDKKSSDGAAKIENMSNEELAEELTNQLLRNCIIITNDF